ncbi:lysM and putative peptidoglycan-binding domain-containing protein 1-like isoform X1 [Stegostoma tigrinum]|uniref:lysM and putative peptidoglycan-binding domain-containing protein 1-like isoform X1 n=1 Tax=Stegostoma tigrinum TaxID=3053191 RepID=UPI0028703B21|nr:lysM and putative peptidoglycan-binding domain-containing protein 1-like isoform X1 [Stegostoma tigrinum]
MASCCSCVVANWVNVSLCCRQNRSSGVNRLYTNDSIFLKECLRIPIPKQGALQNGSRFPHGAPGQPEPALEPPSPELSPTDFLNTLDSKITRSKAAAIRTLDDGSGRLDGAVGGCGGSPVARGCPSERPPASRLASAQRARLGPMCLTKSTRVSTLRETEDQIFDL